MLRRLSVQNYVLIEQLEIDFPRGLNIITGETGAGKSILLGALGLIVGDRADKSVLLDATKKCIVEAEFSVEKKIVKAFFKENELDHLKLETGNSEGNSDFKDQSAGSALNQSAEHSSFKSQVSNIDNVLLRREITAEGRSRSFINDTPVSLVQLKELSGMLVDIHSQHETLLLNQSRFQLSVVDAFAKTEDDLDKYREVYSDYQKQKKKLTELEEQEKKSKTDLDYFQFLFDELDKASLKQGEQEQLEDELNTMTHAEEIKNNLNVISGELNSGDDNLLLRISRLQALLQAAAVHHPKLNDLSERLKSVSIEVKDIASEAEEIGEEISFSPARTETIEGRLNEIYRLEQKHRVKNVTELINLKDDFEKKLKNIESLDEQLVALKQQVETLQASCLQYAKQLSAKRIKAIPKAEQATTVLLSSVNMPHAVFKISNDLLPEHEFTSDGIDRIRFLFSANKGIAPTALNKTASGGELSRLMLCIKAAVAKLMALPVIIFDEIDTGISGETAMNVGKVLKQLSQNHQLIAITHLPQIAGRGDAHYFVYKEIGKQKTAAKVKQLNKDERVVEIAKMLSGEKPTAVAMENAKELLRN